MGNIIIMNDFLGSGLHEVLNLGFLTFQGTNPGYYRPRAHSADYEGDSGTNWMSFLGIGKK